MDKKTVVAGVASVAVVEINEIDVNFMGENIDDDYHYRNSKNLKD